MLSDCIARKLGVNADMERFAAPRQGLLNLWRSKPANKVHGT